MRPGTTTRVPVVLAALVDLIDQGTAAYVPVLLGEAPVDIPDTVVMVAPAAPDYPGVTATTRRDPSLGNADVERVEVAIVLRSYSGDDDMAARVAECGRLVAAVQQLVAANPRRDGVWDRLEPGGEAAWHPVFTDQGANCFVGFSVVATALV